MLISMVWVLYFIIVDPLINWILVVLSSSNVNTMKWMFYDYKAIKNINVLNFFIDNVKDNSSMFLGVLL